MCFANVLLIFSYLLSIVFVKECSTPERRTPLPKMESLGTSLSSASKKRLIRKSAILVSRFFGGRGVNMLFLDYRLLLTCRWKLVEVFMTVVMYRSQKHGRRSQRELHF